jgi:hypothetical protein
MEEQARQENASQAEPELLYHYTDHNGLIGILTNRCIWATDIRYLNDWSEGKLVWNSLFDELNSRVDITNEQVFELFGIPYKQPEGKPERRIDGDTFTSALSSAVFVTTQDAFVASFSEHGDRLSQWRAYSGNGVGFSIGFERNYLRAISESYMRGRADRIFDTSSQLVQCEYVHANSSSSTMKELVKKSVDAFINDVGTSSESPRMEGGEGFQSTSAIALRRFLLLGVLSSITKDSGFSEEAEWRLAFLLNRNSAHAGLKFRASRSVPVPYLEIPLNFDEFPSGIRRVIVGPCDQQRSEAATESAKMLLRQSGIKEAGVDSSVIPYRNW